jgi:7-cyano-7-deazaguanine synthase
MSSAVAALVSGGLDSCVMLSELCRTNERVLPVYVRAGLVWEKEELAALERFLAATPSASRARLRVLDLPVQDLYGAHWSLSGSGVPGYDGAVDSNYLPGRNLLLLAKVVVLCALADADRIAIAPLSDNPFADGTPEFFRAFADVASRALSTRLSIETPFRSLDKAEVIRRGRDLPLELTLSCIQPSDGVHCGECTKCAERKTAFTSAGVADHTRYARRR